MKTACVLGGNGFIFHHVARRLKAEGYWVRVVDIEPYKYGPIDYADEVVHGDLRKPLFVRHVLVDKYQEPYHVSKNFDLVCQGAALMGGAGFIFSGDNDAEVMHDSCLINLNVLRTLADNKFQGKIFWSSSACMYPQQIQEYTFSSALKERDGLPGNPDSSYGWEKLFSEQLYAAYHRNYGIDIRIARFHNIFGPESCYNNGKEKAPAAIVRKVAEATKDIEIWGDGEQTRSFLYIDECVEGIMRLINSDYREPLNIGSDELISINDLAKMVMDIAGKKLTIRHIDGPQGVRGRNSDNTLIREQLNWAPSQPLRIGMQRLYHWIHERTIL